MTIRLIHRCVSYSHTVHQILPPKKPSFRVVVFTYRILSLWMISENSTQMYNPLENTSSTLGSQQIVRMLSGFLLAI